MSEQGQPSPAGLRARVGESAPLYLSPRTSSPRQLHPLPLRIMHWINALAIFIMVGSGWRIYNDDVLFGWLHFPDFLVIGKWTQYRLQFHFLGIVNFPFNAPLFLSYHLVTVPPPHTL